MNAEYNTLRLRLTPRYGEHEARALALLVMEEAFGMGRTEIYADKGSHFSKDDTLRLDNICQRLVGGEPVQYVLGATLFCGRRFKVGPGVLIPRPETEELVDRAFRLADEQSEGGRGLRLLDAGTGSGCIAISLKLALPEAEVTAWELSSEALAIASENAKQLGAEVRFREVNMLSPGKAAAEDFDFIVSNPPYICERERTEMETHVLDHEPAMALFVPDNDPLRFYRGLARLATRGDLLHPGGALLTEINSAYGAATARCFEAEGLRRVGIFRDNYGLERIVEGWR